MTSCRVRSTAARAYLTLESGKTNVLNLTVAELAGLSEITFRTKPTKSTPLVVNVTGGNFDGRMPNTAGIGGSDAPYILWNFVTAQQVRVTSGATLKGRSSRRTLRCSGRRRRTSRAT